MLPVGINTTVTRRNNTLLLFQDYLSQAVAQGLPAKGIEQAFAQAMQISPSLWSQIKSSRPIGDKLARQIESNANKPAGWLDEAHQTSQNLASLQAEQRFIQLALGVWRNSSAAEKKDLTALLKSRVAKS